MQARLEPTPIPTMRQAFGYFRRLVVLVRPYWGQLLKSVFLGLVLTAFGLISPYVAKILFDEVYPTRDVQLMHVLVAATLGLSLGIGMAGAIRSYFASVVATRLSNATVLMFFNHLQHLRMRFFDEHRVGEVMSRFQDVRNSLGAVTRVVGVVLSTGLYLFLVPPLLLILDWRLAFVALISMPFNVATTLGSARLLRKNWKRSAEAHADLNAMQVEALTHVRTIKTLSLERPLFQRIQSQMESAMRLQLQAVGLAQTFGTLNAIISALGTALFTWYSWSLILRDQLTLGEFVAFSAYAGYLFQPIGQWVSLVSGSQQSAVQLGRMFEYLDDPTEQDPQTVYAEPGPIARRLIGELVLRDVSYSYNVDTTVLRDVSLVFPAGSFTSIVGASGAGKSTLLRLLCRMDHPQNGVILADGFPLGQIPLNDLRRQIGVVWQDAALFQGTLWENLTIGLESPDATMVDEIVRVCRLDETLENLPAGYDTPVAEWGASLSAGQKQRIALARILLRDPRVLFLDEATANVDLTTEAEILTNLVNRMSGRTVVMVTHRVTSAALADRICVISDGKVAGLGTHGELLATCAVYRAMHDATKDVADSRHLRMLARGN